MLLNKSRKKGIIENVRFARSFWGRFRGLMFERRAAFDYALVFELPRESKAGAAIHMLFVFFPIDVVYLNSKRRVVDVARMVRPFWGKSMPKKAAKYIVELPAGKARDLGEGDEVAW